MQIKLRLLLRRRVASRRFQRHNLGGLTILLHAHGLLAIELTQIQPIKLLAVLHDVEIVTRQTHRQRRGQPLVGTQINGLRTIFIAVKRDLHPNVLAGLHILQINSARAIRISSQNDFFVLILRRAALLLPFRRLVLITAHKANRLRLIVLNAHQQMVRVPIGLGLHPRQIVNAARAIV